MSTKDPSLDAVKLMAARERDVNRMRHSLTRATAWLRVVDRCVAASREAERELALFEAWCSATVEHTGVPFAGVYRVEEGALTRVVARGPKQLRTIAAIPVDHWAGGAGCRDGGLDSAPELPVLLSTWCEVSRAPEPSMVVIVGYDARTARFVDHTPSETLDYLRMSALNLAALSAQLRARAELERERHQLVEVNAELARRDREISQKNAELGQALTELKRTQNELVHTERLTAVGQLAAGIAHEVNNPATYVASNLEELLELVKQGQLPDWEGRPTKLLEEAASGLDHIVGIIRELGRFSRADRSENDIVPVAEMVESVTRLASNQVKLVATLKIVTAEGLAVRGSRRELTQVLLNLVINAAQAMPKGSVPEDNWIEIRTKRRGDQAVIVVEDTGPGIPADLRKEIFQPFFTTKGDRGGTGLGLSIAIEIAHRHGGSLSIVSTGPQGTCFELALPHTEMEVAAPRVSTKPPLSAKRRVLLVDDDARILRAHARKLARYFDVATAHGPEAALSALRADGNFHAILADLMMPKMNGLELWRAVIAERPRYRGRFFFVSGGIARADLRREIEELAIAVVPKPIRTTDVRELVATIPSDPPASIERAVATVDLADAAAPVALLAGSDHEG